MKRIYYIDYENTGLGVLCELKNKMRPGKDKCVIFWSKHACNFKYEFIEMVKENPDAFQFVKADFGKNALDMQLVAHLLYSRKKHVKYYIVSNDGGYDHAIHMLRKLGCKKVRRLTSTLERVCPKCREKETTLIEESLPEIVEEERKGDLPVGEIERLLKNSKNKSEFHTKLTQVFGMQMGREYYMKYRKQVNNS